MKTIKLHIIGDVQSDWFFNTNSIMEMDPFTSFLSFKKYENPEPIEINPDSITELRDGYPVSYTKQEKYIKRHRIIEKIFGKKYTFKYKSVRSKDKITWIKFNNGTSYYVSESIDHIKKLSN